MLTKKHFVYISDSDSALSLFNMMVFLLLIWLSDEQSIQVKVNFLPPLL